ACFRASGRARSPSRRSIRRGRPLLRPLRRPPAPSGARGAGCAQNPITSRRGEPAVWHRERPLTPREWEILRLVGQGLSNQQIGGRLYLALPTVKNHVHNILEKLGFTAEARPCGRSAEPGR